MPRDVFISHSSQDKAAADAVCAALEAGGINCWIAPRDVPPGVPYAGEIVQAIAGSRLVVLLHSKASNESSQVLKEVERADARRIPIISVRIERCQLSHSLEYFLSAVQWLDATVPPLERHLPGLLNAARALIGRADQSSQPATTGEVPPEPRRSSRFDRERLRQDESHPELWESFNNRFNRQKWHERTVLE